MKKKDKLKDRLPANSGLEAINLLESPRAGRVLARWIIGIAATLVLALFLPWQQNINASGEITALSPENRPQTIQSAIPGRIAEWYKQEGSYVHQGDTILRIDETNDEYFDPQLLSRLQEQVVAQEAAITSRLENTEALKRQISALRTGLVMELEQAQNRVAQAKLEVSSDSIALIAAGKNFEIAEDQRDRNKRLYEVGQRSLTEFQRLEQAQQQTMATKIETEVAFVISCLPPVSPVLTCRIFNCFLSKE